MNCGRDIKRHPGGRTGVLKAIRDGPQNDGDKPMKLRKGDWIRED